MGFFYETGYVRLQDRSSRTVPDKNNGKPKLSKREQRDRVVVEKAIECDESLITISRFLAITGSEYCSVDANTLMYDWNYKQFLVVEKYVDFQEDRRYWSDKGADEDRKLEESKGNRHTKR
ncbi:hypothetical protein VPHG_00105 [Vibrio phage 11895-B1]|uniref:hypothetical protein n=1 Tax=Vibrio phage 11895-B1 TaxID=754075 RepID=UPI0002C11844|nr:hypothetical protein VPHG_00105 [Vibrio phage 11895-B1]AGH32172.1 hypothetical protein VPHG_00105 [Vibrio phage 11895-B1]